MEDLIKCYCGHTTTCDCGPKQETLEQETVEEYFLSNIKNMLQFNNDALAIRFMEKYFEAKQEQERMYSEEEVINLLYIRSMCQEHYESDAEIREWFNKFKKK